MCLAKAAAYNAEVVKGITPDIAAALAVISQPGQCGPRERVISAYVQLAEFMVQDVMGNA